MPHCFAVATLKQPCQLLRLTVLREQRHRYRSHSHSHPYGQDVAGAHPSHGVHHHHHHPLRDDSIHVVLNKSTPDEQLGIKLVRRQEEHGVYISHLLEGGMAARDGQLCVGDRVLAINGHDLRYGAPEHAALLIQVSQKAFQMLITLRQCLFKPLHFFFFFWLKWLQTVNNRGLVSLLVPVVLKIIVVIQTNCVARCCCVYS